MQQPITITVTDAGKKFGKEWIFRHLNLTVEQGQKIVILGLNGSGKSTLLQALTGYLTLNNGMVTYTVNQKQLEEHEHYKFLSLASPYLELIEDFTLQEQIEHAGIYKSFLNGLTTQQVLELSGLSPHASKYIKLFSSGMKQRLKLTLAILADAPILFLDEPTTNLDATVINWYKEMIATYAHHKTIVVCSNSVKEEYEFCETILTMEDLKK